MTERIIWIAIVAVLILVIAINSQKKQQGGEYIAQEMQSTDTLYIHATDTVYIHSAEQQKAFAQIIYGYKTDTLRIDSIRIEYLETSKESTRSEKSEFLAAAKNEQSESLQARANPETPFKQRIFAGASLANPSLKPEFNIGYGMEFPLFANLCISADLQKELKPNFSGKLTAQIGWRF